MFARIHRGHGDDGVVVIGSGDDHRVDIARFFRKHFAPVFVILALGAGF